MKDRQMERTIHELFDLTGKVVVVTGGAGHLGVSMSRAFAEAGASVIVTSRERNRAQELADGLPKINGARHFGIALDLWEPSSIEQGFCDAVKIAEKVDVLVNNAHAILAVDWRAVTAEQFNQQLAIQTGYFLLARSVRNHAVERKAPASIIMIGSMYGLVGSYPDLYEGICCASPVAYHALKGGIIHMTRHLAIYWAKDDVRVNCLSPGPFLNTRKCSAKLVHRYSRKVPMGRIGRPGELKGAVVFLASAASSYMTGQNLVVDGGWTAW